MVARLVASIAVCAVAITACGSGKMTAEETAAELNRTYPPPKWRCIDGDHGWDYICGAAGFSDQQIRGGGIGVEVDEDSVVDRAAP
jgi:hypothetical protein